MMAVSGESRHCIVFPIQLMCHLLMFNFKYSEQFSDWKNIFEKYIMDLLRSGQNGVESFLPVLPLSEKFQAQLNTIINPRNSTRSNQGRFLKGGKKVNWLRIAGLEDKCSHGVSYDHPLHPIQHKKGT